MIAVKAPLDDFLKRLCEVYRVETEPYEIGLEQALDEMGPNHLTEFADALEIEGHPKPPGGHFPMWEAIGTFRQQLADFMVGRDAAFAGGVMVRSYGARLGPTFDYDVLTALDHLKELWKFLEDRDFEYVGSWESVDKLRHREMRLDVDILIADNPLYKEALATARPASWQGRKLKIVEKDHGAAMKVKAYAERRDEEKKKLDAHDFAGLLKQGADVEQVRDILQRLAPKFLPALEEILAGEASGTQ